MALLHNQEAAYVCTPGLWLRSLRERWTSKSSDDPLGEFVANNWNCEQLEPLANAHVDQSLRDFLHCENNEEPTLKPTQTIIIEGYPRTAAQALRCMQWARRYPAKIVFLTATAETAHARSAKRKRDEASCIFTRYRQWEQENKLIGEALSNFTKHFATLEVDQKSVADIADHLSQWMRAAEYFAPSEVPRSMCLTDIDAPPPKAPSDEMEAVSVETACRIIQLHMRAAGVPNQTQIFCGSHPVSLDRASLPRLRRYPYLAALKVDGERMMCLVHAERLYFLSRKLDVWQSRGTWPELREFEGSLLDGELALSNLFIVLDVLRIGTEKVMHRPILERMAKSAPIGRLFFNSTLRFRAQEYVDRTQLRGLLERGAFNGQLEFDGVILQPAKTPYRLGTDFNLFKWKSLGNNTVDLLWMGPESEGDLLCTVIKNGMTCLQRVPGRIHPQHMYAEWLCPNSVFEFAPMPATDGGNDVYWWTPQKPRFDKTQPNADWVVARILQSVRDNITREELTEQCESPALAPNQVPSPPKVRRK